MPPKEPELASKITDIEIIAVGTSIRELADLKADYGGERWRKLKGKAFVMKNDGSIVWAEVHWYECNGIGRRRLKVKEELE